MRWNQLFGGIVLVTGGAAGSMFAAALQVTTQEADSSPLWLALSAMVAVMILAGVCWLLTRPHDHPSAGNTANLSNSPLGPGGIFNQGDAPVFNVHRGAVINYYAAQQLTVLTKEAQEILEEIRRRPMDEEDLALIAHRVERWHGSVYAVFREYFNLAYWTRLHSHVGISIETDPAARISWSRQQHELRNHMYCDLVRLQEMLRDLPTEWREGSD